MELKRNSKGQFEKGNNKDISGKKYGRLTALNLDHMKGKKSYWKFKCDCGNTCIKRMDCLNSNSSCGCLTKEIKSKLMKEKHLKYDEHHESKTRFYSEYMGAKSRCNNINDKDYGGRGIKFEWFCYTDFKKDMYESYLKACKEYGEENVTIERIDVNKNYCKDNCKWIHSKEQAKNKRSTVFVLMNDGRKICMKDFANEIGKSYSCILARKRRSKYKNSKEIPEDILKDNPEVND